MRKLRAATKGGLVCGVVAAAIIWASCTPTSLSPAPTSTSQPAATATTMPGPGLPPTVGLTTTPQPMRSCASVVGRQETAAVVIGAAISEREVVFKPPDGTEDRYALWDVDVETYLVSPLPARSLTVRSLLVRYFDGQPGPPARDPRLTVGERKVMFLQAAKGPGGEDVFALWGGPVPFMPDCNLAVINDEVEDRIPFAGTGSEDAKVRIRKPLESFIKEVTEEARRAGKAVSPSASPPLAALLPEPTCGGPEGFCEKLASEAVTVVRVRVPSPAPEQQRTEPTDSQNGVEFRDWDIEVLEYILKPQPFTRIQVRTFQALVSRAVPGASQPPPMMLKEPSLPEGQNVLLFLNKREKFGMQLGEDQFAIVGPLDSGGGPGFGRLDIEDGWTRAFVFGPGSRPPEPLAAVLAFLKGEPTLPATRESPERAIEKAQEVLAATRPHSPAGRSAGYATVSLLTGNQFYSLLHRERPPGDRDRLLWVVEIEVSSGGAGEQRHYAEIALDARSGSFVASDTRATPLSLAGLTPFAHRLLVWPELEAASHDVAERGDQVGVGGHGGFVFMSPRGYDESNRGFALFLSGSRVGTLQCYVNHCSGTVTIPDEASDGTHSLAVEGGSSLQLQIGPKFTPQPTPTPTSIPIPTPTPAPMYDDVCPAPGLGPQFCGNIGPQPVDSPFRHIDTVMVELRRGDTSARVVHRDHIDTKAGQTRNDIFRVTLPDVPPSQTTPSMRVRLTADRPPEGIAIIEGSDWHGASPARYSTRNLKVEIGPDVKPGVYDLEIKVEINGDDHGTVLSEIRVIE